MKILMTETRKGSEDAFSVRSFTKGNIYDTEVDGVAGITGTLARHFLFHEYAEKIPEMRVPTNPATYGEAL